MTVFAKDPSSTLDYSFDWSGWLAPGETITSPSWTVEPASGSAPVLSGAMQVGEVTAITVAGGAMGNRYRLSCQIETDQGRIAERSAAIRVMEV